MRLGSVASVGRGDELALVIRSNFYRKLSFTRERYRLHSPFDNQAGKDATESAIAACRVCSRKLFRIEECKEPRWIAHSLCPRGSDGRARYNRCDRDSQESTREIICLQLDEPWPQEAKPQDAVSQDASVASATNG